MHFIIVETVFNIDGIFYEDQNKINEYFAIAKCKFLEGDSESCWFKILDETNCILKNENRILCITDNLPFEFD